MKFRLQVALIAGIAIGVTVAHYMVNPLEGSIHDLLQRVYYLPVVLAGLWFGWRGGLLTAFLISVVYFPHAFHGWYGPHTLYFRMSEITMYHVIGGLTGVLSSKLKSALASEQEARKEREAAYERLREKTAELFALEEQLGRSERLAALGRLSAGLAHEIRNPLSSIRTSLELLRERDRNAAARTGARESRGSGEGNGPSTPAPDALSDETPDFHAVLLEETDRLNRILTNFLEFARAEVNKGADEAPMALLADAVAKTAGLLEPQCKKRNVSIDYDPAKLDHLVSLPESHVRQVFLNLFLNAIEAMPRGGSVRVGEVEVDPETESVSLTVDDTGPGIPASSAPHIFDPFFTTKQNGTGLGLSIVERILSANGARIRLDMERLPSSRFHIVLPLANAEE